MRALYRFARASARGAALTLALTVAAAAQDGQPTPRGVVTYESVRESYRLAHRPAQPTGSAVFELGAEAPLLDPAPFDGSFQAPPADAAAWRLLSAQAHLAATAGRGDVALHPDESVSRERALRRDGLVPIGVLALPYIQNGVSRTLNAAAALVSPDAPSVTAGQRVRFVVPEGLVVAADPVSDLRLNLDDGAGPQPLRIGQAVTTTYPTAGPRTLTLDAVVGGIRRVFTLTVPVAPAAETSARGTCLPPTGWPVARPWTCPNRVETVSAAQSRFPFNAGSYAGLGSDGVPNDSLMKYVGNHAAGYRYAVFYGDGNTTGRIQRPIVVTDGVDVGFGFGNGRTPERIFNELLNPDGAPLGRQLVAQGYDVVVFDYGDALDFVERNGLALADCLLRIRDEIPANARIEAAVGPSLGALVVRYALLYLERTGQDARVSMFVSYDGANQGGHLPIGIQKTVDDLVFHSFPGLVVEIATGNFRQVADAVLRSPVVRELLIFNAFGADLTASPPLSAFTTDPLRLQLYTNPQTGLLALGDYPTGPRRVAIVNGAGDGRAQRVREDVDQRISPGQVLFRTDVEGWIFGGHHLMETATNAAPAEGAAGLLYSRKDYACGTSCLPSDVRSNTTWTRSDLRPYDSAPGGYRNTGGGLAATVAQYTGSRITWSQALAGIAQGDLVPLLAPVLAMAAGQEGAGLFDLRVSAPVDNHAFVHTLSALDYNASGQSRAAFTASMFQGQNLSLSVRSDPQRAARTPFQVVYIAGDAPGESLESQDHIELTPGIAAFVQAQLAAVAPQRSYATSTTVPGDAIPAGATVTLAAGVTVTYTGTVTAGPGVTFRMGPRAQLVLRSAASFAGTPSNPVQVVRLDPNQAWERITVLGDGARFENVRLEGGTKTLDVAARGVVVDQCTFRGGWRGVSTYYTPSGARSQLTLSRSLVESSTSVGLVFEHVDAAVDHTVVRQSAEAGLYARNATLFPFTQNFVQDNGIVQTARDGAELYSGAELVIAGSAHNLFSQNGRYELAAFSGARLLAGSRFCEVIKATAEIEEIQPSRCGPGFNIISDTRGGGLLYNGTATTVSAIYNFWGGTPLTSWFSGPVLYAPYLSSAPFGRTPSDELLTSALVAGAGRLSVTNPRAALEAYRGAPGMMRQAWEALVPELEGQARAGGSAAEPALLSLVAQDVASGDYTAARGRIDRLGGAVTSPEGQVELVGFRLALLEQQGRYDEALALLMQSADALPAPFVDLTRTSLLERGAAPTAALAAASARPLFVGTPFPNPSAGAVRIPVSLPTAQRCTVEVFTVDGRRVAVLEQILLAAGDHTLTLPLASVAPGVYVARVRIGDSGEVQSRRVVVIR